MERHYESVSKGGRSAGILYTIQVDGKMKTVKYLLFISAVLIITVSGCNKFDPTTISPSKLMTEKEWVYLYKNGYNISGTSSQPRTAFDSKGVLKRAVAHHVKKMDGPKLKVSTAEKMIMHWIKERVNITKQLKEKDGDNLVVWAFTYDNIQTEGKIKLIIRRCRENDKYTDPQFDIRYDLEIVEKVKFPS